MDSSVRTKASQEHGASASDFAGQYHLGRTLGKGHFAEVKLARHIVTGQLVAVKVIDKVKLDAMATGHLLQEVRCMERVQHPNVVHLYEVMDTPSTLYLVMELAQGGDLHDYILRHQGGVAEASAKRIFLQVVHAVACCHRRHVVHRDLKPENVVFFPQQRAVKLTDFGLSNLFQPGTMLATSCGSLAYSAPEILLGEDYHAPAIDIWSLGVILYTLVCGSPPFHEANESETLVRILDCRYTVPDHISDNCRDLISRMLQKDPYCRASLEEIEAHDWLQGWDDGPGSPMDVPHWLSEAESFIGGQWSTRPGVPESGDLLAARPLPQRVSTAPTPPALPVTPSPEEASLFKTNITLQFICEEEEEEEEEEGSVSSWTQCHSVSPAQLARTSLDRGEDGEQRAEKGEQQESTVKEEAEKDDEEEGQNQMLEEKPMVDEDSISECASHESIRNEVEHDDQTPETVPLLLPACFHGKVDMSAEEEMEKEPINNSKLTLLSSGSPFSTFLPAGDPGGVEACRVNRAGGGGARAGAEEEPPIVPAHSPCLAAVELGRGQKSKLKDRLFQFPLCEKALTFNLPTRNKDRILALAQFNCCHVL